ncbi:hypothetical protein [Olivibacter sp. XZL3]|uniref:hypothetical protein n=1 Tax=Olivibacter sp. XZL3 TaxID=1735116 RepID=UPI001065B7D9|nr:hypothetical protein [Olivibacter sp. XZL3]
MFGKIRKLANLKFSYLGTRSVVGVGKGGNFSVGNNTLITNSHITVAPGSKLLIGNNCSIQNLRLNVNGVVRINDFNFIIGPSRSKLLWNINDGDLTIGSHNRLRNKLLVRFGGVLEIGEYNNINENSEIRCDEQVSIGDFNQISYNCVIWDTNTHNIYSDEKRRELTVKHFPRFGMETERPKTSPVSIGSDCWIGREASVLKGVRINDSCVVGYRTTLSNCVIDKNMTVVSEIKNTIFLRKVAKSGD